MIRLRATKHQRWAPKPGRHLGDDRAARGDRRVQPRACAPDTARSAPPASTATGAAGPRARRRGRPSRRPSARPETTCTPAADRPRPSVARDLEPVRRRAAGADDGDRVRRRPTHAGSPATCSTAGGSARSRSRSGYASWQRQTAASPARAPARAPRPGRSARSAARDAPRSASSSAPRAASLVAQREHHARGARRGASHSTLEPAGERRDQVGPAQAVVARPCSCGARPPMRPAARGAGRRRCGRARGRRRRSRRGRRPCGRRAGCGVAAGAEAVAVVELVEQPRARSGVDVGDLAHARAASAGRCRRRPAGEPVRLALARVDHALADLGRGGAASSRSAVGGRARRRRPGCRCGPAAGRTAGAGGGRGRPRCSGSASSPRPHGHGFEAATSMKRVGKTITCWPRTIVDVAVLERLAQRLEARARRTPTARRGTARRGGRASPRPGSGCGRRRRGRRPRSCGAARGTAAGAPARRRRAGPATDWMRVTSIASSGVSGGRIDGRRRASIVLPVPGGPCRNRLWPPAAATSSAGDERVVAADVGEVGHRLGLGLGRRRPARPAARRVAAQHRRPPRSATSTPRTSTPGTSAASRARERGSTSRASPCRRAPSATASAPRIARTSPVSESSPTTAQPSTRLGVELAGGDEERDRERQVERRADLAQVGRREVDRDPLLRELVARVDDRRPDALARLAHRLVGEADDRERGQPEPDVGLDPDPPGLDAVDGEGGDAGEHGQNAASRWSRRTSSPRASSDTPTRVEAQLGAERAVGASVSQAIAIGRTCDRLRSCRFVPRLAEPRRRVLTSPKTSVARRSSAGRGRARRSGSGGCGRGRGSRGARSARRRAPRRGGPLLCGRSVMARATVCAHRVTDQRACVTNVCRLRRLRETRARARRPGAVQRREAPPRARHACGRRVRRIEDRAPVGRVGAALDQAAPLEPVEHAGQRRRPLRRGATSSRTLTPRARRSTRGVDLGRREAEVGERVVQRGEQAVG